MARAYATFTLKRPLVLVAMGFGLVTLLAGVVLGNSLLIFLGLWSSLLTPALALVLYFKTVKVNGKRLPVGSRIAVGLGETRMRTEGPLGSSDANYRAYSKVFRAGDFVFLRIQGSSNFEVLPIELFPGADFEALVESVRRANL